MKALCKVCYAEILEEEPCIILVIMKQLSFILEDNYKTFLKICSKLVTEIYENSQ